MSNLPGIHLNFLLLIIGSIIICAIAGVLIGLPTLRLRGDYIAIVTLAFGEIIGRVFANGDEVTIFGDNKLSNGRQSIAPIDQINLPVLRRVRLRVEPAALLLDRLRARASSCCS